MTIGFSMCTTIFIYSPSVSSQWNGLFIPLNVTIASVMACRLFRELKLGRFVDPMADDVISKIVDKAMGNIPQEQSAHPLEPHIGGEEVGTSAARRQGVLGDRKSLDKDIELEERGTEMR
jgi:hypothetical protein